MIQNSGSQLVTASAQVGGATNHVRVLSMHIIGTGADVSVSLRNGGSGSTIFITEVGTSGKGVSFVYPTTGFLFPNGLYVTLGANVTSAMVSFASEP